MAMTFLSDKDFMNLLTANIPHLRAYARSLCGGRDIADDLVQETMMKAWSARERFQAGTNFKAWSFTILRNHYFTLSRRNRFVGDWDDYIAEVVLSGPPSQDMHAQLNDVIRALAQLPVAQREALVLIGAAGLSYEEVADMCGVAVGTIKSRVARGRAALEELIDGGVLTEKRAESGDMSQPVISIMAYVERLAARASAARTHSLAA